MNLETTVVLSDDAIARSYSWLQSALVCPPKTEEERQAFLLQGLATLKEDATATANRAFQRGVAFGRRNPTAPEF